MTLPSRHRIRNSSPGGLRPSTLPLGHRGSPQYWVLRVDGEELFQTAETRKQTPNSSVKGSGAIHYPIYHLNKWQVLEDKPEKWITSEIHRPNMQVITRAMWEYKMSGFIRCASHCTSWKTGPDCMYTNKCTRQPVNLLWGNLILCGKQVLVCGFFYKW